ncbi:MAG: cytochrome c [Pseudomonadota bacterium]|nr:cytochrome c [Pseudomonadota bacterium]
MSFIHSPQRIWLDIAVGIVLVSMLVFGSIGIYRLNNDARERELTSALAQRGQELSTGLGCVACHTVDGSPGVGPSWEGMWGRTETLTNGNTIVVDEAYFRESLIDPPRKMVAGYPNVMLRYFLEDEEITALMEFAKQLSPQE